MDIGYRKIESGYRAGEVFIYQTKYPSLRARLAIDLLERWGLVASRTDGEDSAGRQQIELMAPAEIVGRACNIADLAISEMEARGWLLEVPVPTQPET